MKNEECGSHKEASQSHKNIKNWVAWVSTMYVRCT